MTDCDLIDMGYCGSPYTWSDYQTKERLDRSLWTEELQNLFPCSRITHLHSSTSDHSPLLVAVSDAPVRQSGRRKALFSFEQYWATHQECEEVIQRGWQTAAEGDPMSKVCQRIKQTGKDLFKWQKSTFKFRQVEMRAIRARLDDLMKTPFVASDLAEKQALQAKFQELLTQEETLWIQDLGLCG
ncbi:uncharacterized protein LOC133737146 [Rosa rugosa]|uniref:uncharacterized protein LOC133737146 n=1 Tax=Rosa rugosa TaxID=74645 RepID=UPI002B40C378|nr:uncharacterized protein LOC133737146 [Rosa rugosa]